jgi:hypothetical protein
MGILLGALRVDVAGPTANAALTRSSRHLGVMPHLLMAVSKWGT